MFHRRSIRLNEYDYAKEGAYFVTICTFQRHYLFGEVVKGEMVCNLWGEIVNEEWEKTEIARPNVELDAFVVMPNHFHGIIVITNEIVESRRGMACHAHDVTIQDTDIPTPIDKQSTKRIEGLARQTPTFGRPISGSLATIIGAFKSAVTRRVNQLRNQAALYEGSKLTEALTSPIWQRNYYEHIIRNQKRLDDIRDYIALNPQRWETDSLFEP